MGMIIGTGNHRTPGPSNKKPTDTKAALVVITYPSFEEVAIGCKTHRVQDPSDKERRDESQRELYSPQASPGEQREPETL